MFSSGFPPSSSSPTSRHTPHQTGHHYPNHSSYSALELMRKSPGEKRQKPTGEKLQNSVAEHPQNSLRSNTFHSSYEAAESSSATDTCEEERSVDKLFLEDDEQSDRSIVHKDQNPQTNHYNASHASDASITYNEVNVKVGINMYAQRDKTLVEKHQQHQNESHETGHVDSREGGGRQFWNQQSHDNCSLITNLTSENSCHFENTSLQSQNSAAFSGELQSPPQPPRSPKTHGRSVDDVYVRLWEAAQRTTQQKDERRAMKEKEEEENYLLHCTFQPLTRHGRRRSRPFQEKFQPTSSLRTSKLRNNCQPKKRQEKDVFDRLFIDAGTREAQRRQGIKLIMNEECPFRPNLNLTCEANTGILVQQIQRDNKINDKYPYRYTGGVPAYERLYQRREDLCLKRLNMQHRMWLEHRKLHSFQYVNHTAGRRTRYQKISLTKFPSFSLTKFELPTPSELHAPHFAAMDPQRLQQSTDDSVFHRLYHARHQKGRNALASGTVEFEKKHPFRPKIRKTTRGAILYPHPRPAIMSPRKVKTAEASLGIRASASPIVVHSSGVTSILDNRASVFSTMDNQATSSSIMLSHTSVSVPGTDKRSSASSIKDKQTSVSSVKDKQASVSSIKDKQDSIKDKRSSASLSTDKHPSAPSSSDKRPSVSSSLGKRPSVSSNLDKRPSVSSSLNKPPFDPLSFNKWPSVSSKLAKQASVSSILENQDSISSTMAKHASVSSSLDKQISVSSSLDKQASLSSTMAKKASVSSNLESQDYVASLNDKRSSENSNFDKRSSISSILESVYSNMDKQSNVSSFAENRSCYSSILGTHPSITPSMVKRSSATTFTESESYASSPRRLSSTLKMNDKSDPSRASASLQHGLSNVSIQSEICCNQFCCSNPVTSKSPVITSPSSRWSCWFGKSSTSPSAVVAPAVLSTTNTENTSENLAPGAAGNSYQSHRLDIHDAARSSYDSRCLDVHDGARSSYDSHRLDVHYAARSSYDSHRLDVHDTARSSYDSHRLDVHDGARSSYDSHRLDVHDAARSSYDSHRLDVHDAARSSYDSHRLEVHDEDDGIHDEDDGIHDDHESALSSAFSVSMNTNESATATSNLSRRSSVADYPAPSVASLSSVADYPVPSVASLSSVADYHAPSVASLSSEVSVPAWPAKIIREEPSSPKPLCLSQAVCSSPGDWCPSSPTSSICTDYSTIMTN